MSYDHKITDLKFHIDKLIPKFICDSFINFFEDNKESSGLERSYKFIEKKQMEDNFKCINLSYYATIDRKFDEPLEAAKKYIAIMIQNYVLHIQKNICPTFNDKLICNSPNIRIIKYGVGESIKDHVDVAVYPSATASGSIRASCTLNLNEDYDGGEFRFFNGQIKHTFVFFR